MLRDPLADFLEALASEKPTPGGGSASALAGALGAALVAMVCRLTLGRRAYGAVEEEMRATLSGAEGLRRSLEALVEEDAQAYGAVARALALPRGSEEERGARRAALQAALATASEVPLRTAEACHEVLRLAEAAAAQGNKNAVSDAGVAALLALAGLRGALLNVRINLPLLEDGSLRARLEGRSRELLAAALPLAERVLATTEGRIP